MEGMGLKFTPVVVVKHLLGLSHQNWSPPKIGLAGLFWQKNLSKLVPMTTVVDKISPVGPILAAKTNPSLQILFPL